MNAGERRLLAAVRKAAQVFEVSAEHVAIAGARSLEESIERAGPKNEAQDREYTRREFPAWVREAMEREK